MEIDLNMVEKHSSILRILVALFYTVLTYKVAFIYILHPKRFCKCGYSF